MQDFSHLPSFPGVIWMPAGHAHKLWLAVSQNPHLQGTLQELMYYEFTFINFNLEFLWQEQCQYWLHHESAKIPHTVRLACTEKTHRMSKTAWKAVLYSASLFWSHLSRIRIDISDSWREWPLLPWAPAACTSAAAPPWYNSRVSRGPLHFVWSGKIIALC